MHYMQSLDGADCHYTTLNDARQSGYSKCVLDGLTLKYSKRV